MTWLQGPAASCSPLSPIANLYAIAASVGIFEIRRMQDRRRSWGSLQWHSSGSYSLQQHLNSTEALLAGLRTLHAGLWALPAGHQSSAGQAQPTIISAHAHSK